MLRILVVGILSVLLASCSGSSRLEEIVPTGRTRRRGIQPRSTPPPRTSRKAALLSPRNHAPHLRQNGVARLRRNHEARLRQNHKKRRKPRVKALVKSELEFDREAKRNRDPSETPCYLCNCNYIEVICSDDSCPNFPARETLLATIAL
jgi:hypothetical protein